MADATRGRDLAGEVDDPESHGLMIERITLHEKAIRMLNCILKD